MSTLQAMMAQFVVPQLTQAVGGGITGGSLVTYHSAALGDLAITVTPQQGELEPRQTDERRTLHHLILISVPKAALAAVAVNDDTVTIPGAWVEKSTDQTLRVSRIVKRFDADNWLLALD